MWRPWLRRLQRNSACLSCAEQLTAWTSFWWKPTWRSLREVSQSPRSANQVNGVTAGKYWSSSVSDSHFRKEVMLHGRTAARRAHLRSHCGFNAGAALAHCPTAPEYTTPPHLFRTLLLERLQLSLQVTEARCKGCHALLDTLGRHRASCTRSGRVKKRGTPIERVVGRIFREAGASYNVFKKDMNVQVAAGRQENRSSRPEPPLLWRSSVGNRCHFDGC